MKKVLILTGRFGMGHVSAAKSLEEQILGEYPQVSVEVVDLLEYTAPRLAGAIYKTFGFLAKHGRSLYNFIYKQAGKRDEREWSAFTALSMRRLTELMEDKKPQVVVSTLPLCSLLTSKYKERRDKDLTLVTCITDISSHGEWIQANTDYYLVGGDLVKRQLMAKGVEEDSVIVTGIPVRRAFSENVAEAAAKPMRLLGRQAAEGCGIIQAAAESDGAHQGEQSTDEVKREKRLLIMGGGLGLLPVTPEFYQELSGIPGVRITVITGKNQKLYKMLKGRFENVEAIPFTDRVDLYMKRADVILTKPGGITLFETIFSGKPILMFAPFLQQEVNNMHFALYHHIGRVLPKKQAAWAEEIKRLMLDDCAIRQMTCRVRQLRENYNRDGLRLIFGSPDTTVFAS